MSDYKISIVMPVFNASQDLPFAFESIINQSMNLNNIEVIIVDDCSTDNSLEIIKEYCEKYPNFKVFSMPKNVGAAYGPRNVGLKYATGKYIMFLDSDDQFHINACESLYNAINNHENVDIAFARYFRVYPKENKILKSYSPYYDNIVNYKDDLVEGADLSGIIGFLWKHYFSKLIYGNKKSLPQNNIFIKDIKDYPEIFKILPSIWTKIYRTEFIRKYDLYFPSFISGEDLNFVVESFFLATGIIFLNETIIHDYYMRNFEEDKSITKNINYPLVYDSLLSYYNCCKICKKVNFKNSNILINPFLLNWINLYKKSNLNKKEKKELYKTVKNMGKIYNNGLIAKCLILFIKLLLKI